MKTLAAILLVGLSPMAIADPLPLEGGKNYRITFADKDAVPLDLWTPGTPVRIVRVYDYPWVEVEYRWTPSISMVDGKRVEPKTKVLRRYLNLNHVVSILPNDGKPSQRDEQASGGDGEKGK